ncbi:MAG: threonine-phosphate decarboxylase [Nitrosopumilus sp. H8]|nr:MAG: threonine-phosphate decarboxylase [Nitrosopumilus sp. H8]
MGIRDPHIVDFSSNINPAGIPDSAVSALRRGLGRAAEYPDAGSLDLVSALARYTGLGRANILAGNGAAEIIYNFCSTLVPGRRVLVPVPTFAEYEAASRLAGCRVSFFKTMNLADDLDRFVSRIPKDGCVFVCNPNNPTGSMISKKQMSRIVAAASARSCMVFADECFIELTQNPEESVISMVKRRENLLVLRSLTKSFGLAGVRVGYAAASKETVRILRNVKIPWSISCMAQEAGIAAVKDRRHLQRSRKIIRTESEFLRNKMSQIPGIQCSPSSANFVLVRTRQDSARLQKKLLRRGVLVRDCGNFRGLGSNYIRVAVRTRRENLLLLRALEAVA